MNSLRNDIKTYLSLLFQKSVDDYNIVSLSVYYKFYRAFCLMFDYRLVDVILEINSFKKLSSDNIVTSQMINRLELFQMIPTVVVETTRINLKNIKPVC